MYSSYFVGFAVISLTTTVAVLGMLLVRKKVGLKMLNSYHEVAGYLLSVIGTLYAVLLGFIVVDSMNHLQETRLTVEQEANSLANVFFVSDGLPPARKNQIQELCRRYANLVITEEWPLMHRGETSQDTFKTIWRLWKVCDHMEPSTQRDQNIQQTLMSELCSLCNSRRTRIIHSQHGVAPIMWVVLITGGLFTVVFTYFFGLESMGAQMLMTALVAITLSLNVFLVFLFGYPFSGDLAVTPESFQLDLRVFAGFAKETQDITSVPVQTQ